MGLISPKIRTSSVSTPVAAPTERLPNTFVEKIVISEDAERFTILLPIRIALSILPGLWMIRSTRLAAVLPSSMRVRSRMRLMVV